MSNYNLRSKIANKLKNAIYVNKTNESNSQLHDNSDKNNTLLHKWLFELSPTNIKDKYKLKNETDITTSLCNAHYIIIIKEMLDKQELLTCKNEIVVNTTIMFSIINFWLSDIIQNNLDPLEQFVDTVYMKCKEFQNENLKNVNDRLSELLIKSSCELQSKIIEYNEYAKR